MNLIIDGLPDTVLIGGAEYLINTNFRTSMLFEIMMQDNEMADADKTKEALNLYYPKRPPSIQEACEKILWFYKCGKRQNRHGTSSGNGAQHSNVYSFEYDDDYIYAAFKEQYDIDLVDIDYMHWWKFRALFKGLKEDCEFVKIMGYRSITISGKMSKEQKDFYHRMKEIHALPVSESEQKKMDAITQVLLNGGDLTGLI